MQLFSTFNLSFCNLATVLATFLKIGLFFQTSGHSAPGLRISHDVSTFFQELFKKISN
jgi:hypothetical protein